MIEWRDVKGYEGLYQVSKTGLVRSVDRITTGNRSRKIKGKILRPGTNGFGYLVVALCKDGKARTKRVHRLVATAFIPCENENLYINHKDGNPQNNNVSNLEWCTQKENVQHAYDTGLNPSTGILTASQIEYIQSVYKPYSREFGTGGLSRKLGVHQSVVWNALHGKRKILC